MVIHHLQRPFVSQRADGVARLAAARREAVEVSGAGRGEQLLGA